MVDINTRIEVLRNLIQQRKYDFYLVPSKDPHNDEYVPIIWQRRKWITDFDGSAGDALISPKDAFLWVDGRYILQAEKQLIKHIYRLHKQETSISDELLQWLTMNAHNKTLALDPATVSINQAQSLISTMQSIQGQCIFDNINLVDNARKLCNENIILTHSDIHLQKLKFSGIDTETKIDKIRKIMKEVGVDNLIVNVLDEIAWMLNIRGNDINFNPLVILVI